MQGVNRIIFNTAVLYAKILICMAISLYTVPLLLHALGDSDYGLFNLIGGIISMLAFMNAAMTLSTQRYLSVTIGEGNHQKLLEVYNISIILHVIIGLAVVILIELSMPLLFEYVLNIEQSRIPIAHLLFHLLVVSMFFHILAVPFDALINAYEEMMAFSVISILESVLRLSAAVLLYYISYDKLEIYGYAIALISLFIFVVKFAYSHFRYRHLRLSLSVVHNKSLFFQMFSFAGWNTLSSLAIISRNQGIALVLNHFYGTIINTAYGIGNQVNGVLGYFSATIQKSINPQLMQSEGMHERQRLTMMSGALTKYSLLCLGLLALPLLIETHTVLLLWLGEIPQHTIEFTRIIIILSIIFQSTSGIMSAVQSTGNIKWYTIFISTILISTIPIVYIGTLGGLSPVTVLWSTCAIELLATLVRLNFARLLLNYPVITYLKDIVVPCLTLIVSVGVILFFLTILFSPSVLRLLLVCIADVILFGLGVYYFLLSPTEHDYITKLFDTIKHLRH